MPLTWWPLYVGVLSSSVLGAGWPPIRLPAIMWTYVALQHRVLWKMLQNLSDVLIQLRYSLVHRLLRDRHIAPGEHVLTSLPLWDLNEMWVDNFFQAYFSNWWRRYLLWNWLIIRSLSLGLTNDYSTLVLVTNGTKPLPEPILTQVFIVI